MSPVGKGRDDSFFFFFSLFFFFFFFFFFVFVLFSFLFLGMISKHVASLMSRDEDADGQSLIIISDVV